MEKTLKNTTAIKQLNLQVNFEPVGNLVAPKLALYSYFGKLNGTADYSQSGKKFCEVFGGNSFVDLKDEIPIVKEYEFKNSSNSSQNYSPFVNAYTSGKINTIIKNIKDYVRIEFPAKVEEIALKIGTEKEKAKNDFRNYVQNDLIREIVKATISETDLAFTPTMTFLLNPLAILNIQYNYMLQADAQEGGGACSQMKQGVKDFIAEKWWYYNTASGSVQNKCINAINQKCQNILAENKILYQNVLVANNSTTSIIHYLNENLDELYKYIGSPIPISQGQVQQGADLAEELNFLQGNGNNKNKKSKGINLTTILLLALPIVVIILIKKKGK